jgi:diguanylate cyclase (GGDEF)-like protein
MKLISQLLIVDESAARREAFRRIVGDCGAELVEARSGIEAVALAARQPFAAIVLSTKIAAPDIFDTLEQLQQREPSRLQPVIVISPIDDPAERDRAYALGAVDYLPAPMLDALVLQQKLRVFASLQRQQLEVEQLLGRFRDDSDELFRQNEHLLAASRETLRRATHDSLTELPNRALFEDRLQAAIRRSERGRKCFAVATVSLDRVPAIAAAEGMAAANEWRVKAASRLCATVRASDTVARLGADDFVVLIEAIDTPRRAQTLGNKLADSLGAPLRLSNTDSGRPLMLSPQASVGLAVYPNDAQDVEGLMMLSGLALMRARQLGGSGVSIYSDSPDMAASGQPDGVARYSVN